MVSPLVPVAQAACPMQEAMRRMHCHEAKPAPTVPSCCAKPEIAITATGEMSSGCCCHLKAATPRPEIPAILPVVVPGAILTLITCFRSRSFRPLGGVILGGTLIFGPWLAKNFVDTGNPVYPLAWSIFGGIDRDADDDAKWSRAHGRKPLEIGDLRRSVIDVAGRSDWQTPLFLAFLPLTLMILPLCSQYPSA